LLFSKVAPVPVGLESAMSKIVHFEIPVDDAARATAFYRDALGWEFSGFGDQPYWLVRAGTDDEPGANGALLARGELHRSPVLIVGVNDLDAALARVESSGGRVLQGKLAVPGVGWAAYFADSEENTIGLFEPDANAVGNA
jgi:predicted enzyme related to lactoylglutathione lyase